jgi:hypothetical protein
VELFNVMFTFIKFVVFAFMVSPTRIAAELCAQIYAL